MANVITSTAKTILGMTILLCAGIQAVEAVERVPALSWRFSSSPQITRHHNKASLTNMRTPSACANYITAAELRHGIPANLLQAVSKVESGKVERGQLIAWPWTINVEGKGYFYPTKQAAIAAVQQFQKEGKRSIDVGCMQVNLLHHPDAFPSLSMAFDPRQNVEYAARFLKGLTQGKANWHQAVAHYHSTNPEHHIPYRKRVLSQWSKEKKTSGNPTTLANVGKISKPPPYIPQFMTMSAQSAPLKKVGRVRGNL